MQPEFTAHLSDRRLIRVTGEDAMPFLQNIITNDMRRLAPDRLLYACLLTPQGQYLHDFFIIQEGQGYLLDCEAVRADDLLRRFGIFKLRSRVNFTDMPEIKVYATTKGGSGYADPRKEGMGFRVYTKEILAAESVERYYDFCIDSGIPCGSLTIRPERETMADVNLDLLNAVAWDKGCFIGQEVAARMHNRGLSKRRLFVVTGHGLAAGVLRLDGNEAGEIRQVNSSRDKALAVIKLAAASQKAVKFVMGQGNEVTLEADDN